METDPLGFKILHPWTAYKNVIETSRHFQRVNDAFPQVGKKLKLFWGHHEFAHYMDGLQQEKEGKVRAGFPENVLTALFYLNEEHEAAFPELMAKPADRWAVYADRR